LALWVAEQLKKGFSVILAGYKLGKAQELTKFVNTFFSTPPIVHPQIAQYNAVYEQHGISLGPYFVPSDSEAKELAKSPAIFILPPTLVNLNTISVLSSQYNRRFVTAFATGWANHFFGRSFTKSFVLSSHADFNQLLSFVAEVEPKQVFTMHGYAAEFARAIKRRLHIPAKPLPSTPQATLRSF